MSAGADQTPGREDRKRAPRLGPLPRPLALVLLAIWAGLTIAAVIGLVRGPAIWSGDREGLIPHEHRTPRGQAHALIRVKLDAPSSAAAAGEAMTELDHGTTLAEAGFAIEEALANERVPLAPPKTEITRWLDAHALYLLPLDTHDALAERLSDARMLAEVQGLEARLSSPLFSVSGEQPRRDPLGIHELTRAEAGRLGHVAEAPGSDEPQVSPSGDLLAASGDRMLIALRSTRAPNELLADLRAAVEGLAVEVELVDPRAAEASLAAALGGSPTRLGDGVRVAIACFAALILLLSVVMRRLVPVLALGLCLASVWAVVLFAVVRFELVGGGVELISAALSLVLLGFGCDAALRLQPIGLRGWASTLVTVAALVPLLFTPYPLWQRWALIWAGALLLVAVVMRVILPSLLALSRSNFEWRQPGFRLVPMPVLAVGVCFVLTGMGAWATAQLRYRPGTRPPTVKDAAHLLERELVEHFFDPTMIVEAHSSGEGGEGGETGETGERAAALDASAADFALLAKLVPGDARRVDSPGSFILPRAELEARQLALRSLKLGERMEALDSLLVDQGLRAEAFAEFVRGAANIEELPSAQAALDGPLGPWISTYLSEGEGPTQLRSRVELRGREGLAQPPLTPARLAGLPALRGPAIAATLDQREFDKRIGVVILMGLWLSAFLVWLGTGSLGIALSVAVVAVASECGVLLGLALLDQPWGPHIIPIVLVTGAAAAVAGGRACRAVSLGQPIVARGLLLVGACQVVVGIVLLTSAQPLWRELGLALAIGSVLACGLGLFATPGLASLFEKLRRRSGKPRAAKQPVTHD